MLKPAFFLDRDGVINEENGYVHKIIDFKWIPGSKEAIKSPLDNIDGLGAKTKELLIKEFKSLKRIKAASQEEITKLLGQVRGGNIFKRLNEL